MTATAKTHLRLLSQSGLACFRRCPREYQYRYVALRRTLRKSEALSYGTLWDRGTKAWWESNGAPEDRLRAAIDAMHA